MTTKKPRTYNQIIDGNRQKAIESVLKSKALLPEQIKTIKKFIEYNESKGVSINTLRNYARGLSWLCKVIKKPFEQMTKDDLIKYFASIKDKKGISYSNKIIIRVFFKWLIPQKNPKDFPEIVSWITIPRKSPDSFDDKEILTPTDIKKLADNARCFRDKVFILVLFDSASRVSEVLGTRIKDYTVNEHGVNMFIPSSKTRKRNIQLIESAPDVIAYLNQHPYKENPDAPMFFKDRPRGEALGEKGARAILKKLKKKIGLNKKTNPHWLRHSKLTLEAQDLTDSQLKIYAGWSKSSQMASRYIHLKDSDVTKIRLIKKGILDPDSKEAKDDSLAIKECPRCKEKNTFSDEHCRRCWIPLNRKAYQEMLNAQTEINQQLMEKKLPPTEEVILSIVKSLMEKGLIPKK